MTIQIARQRGYKALNVVRRRGVVESLKAEGATYVFVHGEEDLKAGVMRATKGKGVPYVFDAVGGKMGKKRRWFQRMMPYIYV